MKKLRMCLKHFLIFELIKIFHSSNEDQLKAEEDPDNIAARPLWLINRIRRTTTTTAAPTTAAGMSSAGGDMTTAGGDMTTAGGDMTTAGGDMTTAGTATT